MQNEEYFNEFISFMNNREELFNGNAYEDWGHRPKFFVYNKAKSYLKDLYKKSINVCGKLSKNELLEFEEIWAEIHKITFDYCNRLNKKSRSRKIRKIQRYMVDCFIRKYFDEEDLKDGGVTSEVARIYLSPPNSDRGNYIAVNWENLYESVHCIVRAKKYVERTMEITGQDFSFPSKYRFM